MDGDGQGVRDECRPTFAQYLYGDGLEGAETLVPGLEVGVVGFAELGSEVGVLGVGEGHDASALVRREGRGASGAQVPGCVIWSSIAGALAFAPGWRRTVSWVLGSVTKTAVARARAADVTGPSR